MRNDNHQNYHLFSNCPICNVPYDQYWKIVSHIRKTKDASHQDFLKIQKEQYIEIYLNSDRKDFYNHLFAAQNIFAGTAFSHSSAILLEKFTPEEMEKIRKDRISKTMENVPKTQEHNDKVSEGVKRAWSDGKFNTPEICEAKAKGYANRQSFAGSNNPMYGQPCPIGSGTGKGGIRPDIGHYVRSRWEANICRVCNYVGRIYEYEKMRFKVTINGVDYTYCPDLYFPAKDLYYEVKGHAQASNKWICPCLACEKNRLIIPEVIRNYGIHLIIVGKAEYKHFMKKFAKRIPEWESHRNKKEAAK